MEVSKLLTIPFPVKGEIISIPSELLVTKRFFGIAAKTHLVLSLHDKKNMSDKFKIILINGMPTGGYMEVESFLKIDYIPCTLDQYMKMKVFL